MPEDSRNLVDLYIRHAIILHRPFPKYVSNRIIYECKSDWLRSIIIIIIIIIIILMIRVEWGSSLVLQP
jgi:hypothetical protein